MIDENIADYFDALADAQCTFGSITVPVILDAPSIDLGLGELGARAIDRQITFQTSALAIKERDVVVMDAVSYKVRGVSRIEDGKISTAGLVLA